MLSYALKRKKQEQMDAKEVNLSKEFVDKISPGTTKLKLPIAGVKKIKIHSWNS